MHIDWSSPVTAPSNIEIEILYEDAHGRHTGQAKRPKGATSWHDARSGVEITQGRFFKGWRAIRETRVG